MSLGYLWQRDQPALLQEMIDSNVEAILVKVAAMGSTNLSYMYIYTTCVDMYIMCISCVYLSIFSDGGWFRFKGIPPGPEPHSDAAIIAAFARHVWL